MANASQDTLESKKPEKASVAKRDNVFVSVAQFLREVAIEHHKITWPDTPQILRETRSVIVLVACITLLVLAFDWVLGQAVFGPLEHLARTMGGR
jgi:preprotein translocase SecE subunit